MIVKNPDNAGLMPGPGISLAILSNSFSALTAVSFATERLVGAVSERDGMAFEVGVDTEVAGLYTISDAAPVAERSARGCLARDGVGSGVEVLEGSCCWTRLRFDEEGCDPEELCFPNFLATEENFGDKNFRMMKFKNKAEHEASQQDKLVTNPRFRNLYSQVTRGD